MNKPQLHVKVDPLICQGTGYCVRLADDIFELSDDNIARVIQSHPSADREALMEEAATLCPTRAITY